MADVINLRLARKARRRAEAGQQADANRGKFGRTKGERLGQTQEADRAARLLDGARRDTGEPD